MWNGMLETLFEWSDNPLKGLSVSVFLPLSNVVKRICTHDVEAPYDRERGLRKDYFRTILRKTDPLVVV